LLQQFNTHSRCEFRVINSIVMIFEVNHIHGDFVIYYEIDLIGNYSSQKKNIRKRKILIQSELKQTQKLWSSVAWEIKIFLSRRIYINEFEDVFNSVNKSLPIKARDQEMFWKNILSGNQMLTGDSLIN
jgi:hypothetical protein